MLKRSSSEKDASKPSKKRSKSDAFSGSEIDRKQGVFFFLSERGGVERPIVNIVCWFLRKKSPKSGTLGFSGGSVRTITLKGKCHVKLLMTFLTNFPRLGIKAFIGEKSKKGVKKR